MSYTLADIDATCAALGLNDGNKYYADPDALACTKHLIWILRRDDETHEYRRHLGSANIMQTDLLPMMICYCDNIELADVLLRLLVNLTSPTLLLYREELPKDVSGRRNFLELIEILQRYKESFADQSLWSVLTVRLQKNLEIDWAERSEEQGLLIERVLVLIRNVLQIPANPDAERRADNDASIHDQILWALQQSGILDLVLFVLSSDGENQYHLHALEIICLMFREQTATGLADASLQRSLQEKERDEQELVSIRNREKAKLIAKPPPLRHSRFGGTYVLQNVKSISDKDIICHQSLERAAALDFDKEKVKQKRSHRIVQEQETFTRRSAFSIRLFLREYCIQVLQTAYNSLVRQVRRVLEQGASGSGGHDDSYLLWAIRFFMEFNRFNDFRLDLVSESLSVHCFHWILTRIQHDLDMLTSDKKHARLWSKRLHIAVMAFRELLFSLHTLQKFKDKTHQALFNMIQNNVFYVLEYRETMLHLLMDYNELHSTKSYLRDVVETANFFVKMLEKFCQGTVYVQEKKNKRGKGKKSAGNRKTKVTKNNENLEDTWARIAPEISVVLANDIKLPEDEHPIPFDAAADKSIDDQKGDCMLRIHSMLRQEKFEHAIVLMRSAREVWPEDDTFGSLTSAPEDELMLLHEVFGADLGTVEKINNQEGGKRDMSLIDGDDDNNDDADYDGGDDTEGEDEEEDESNYTEKEFRFEDFAKRLVNPKVVRACTMVLSDWEKISTRALKSAVTILHRVAFGCKMPGMLYQASLFRIFQHVLNSPRESHQDELCRLAIYVVRQFVEAAPKNLKIYTELLFYKGIKEVNDMEHGYDTNYDGGSKVWSEEQEDELRRLYMENQNSPATDQDVIDWILDNLIDRTRTRRGIIKKLKELGLIFKAPTKKSNAAAVKGLWTHDQDNKLKELFNEHRLETDALTKIMAEFDENRSQNVVIKRMIQLGLIADKSEILPAKLKKNKRTTKKNDFDNDSDNSDNENEEQFEFVQNDDGASVLKLMPSTKKKPSNKKGNKMGKKSKKSEPAQQRKINVVQLELAIVKKLIAEMNEEFKETLEWLRESLEDVSEDLQDEDAEADDAIPLVPIIADQREAMETDIFKKLLTALGFQAPLEEMETYWRIPNHMKIFDLKIRCQLLAGEDVEDMSAMANNGIDNDADSDSDTTDGAGDVEMELRRNREKVNTLMYSDDDEQEIDVFAVLRKRRDNLMQSNNKVNEGHDTNDKKSVNASKRNKINLNDVLMANDSDGNEQNNIEEDDTQTLQDRLNDLESNDDDEDGDDEDDVIMSNKSKMNNSSINKRGRIKYNQIESSDSENEEKNMGDNNKFDQTNKSKANILKSHRDTNAIQLFDQSISTRLIDDEDDRNDGNTGDVMVGGDINVNENSKDSIGSKKRERSDSENSLLNNDENQMQKKSKKTRRIRIVSDDDNDDDE